MNMIMWEYGTTWDPTRCGSLVYSHGAFIDGDTYYLHRDDRCLNIKTRIFWIPGCTGRGAPFDSKFIFLRKVPV